MYNILIHISKNIGSAVSARKKHFNLYCICPIIYSLNLFVVACTKTSGAKVWDYAVRKSILSETIKKY